MNDGATLQYTASYRRGAMLVPALLLALVTYLAILGGSIGNVGTNALLTIALVSTGVFVVLTIALLLSALRVHRWQIETQGLRIEERPKVAFAGFTKHVFARWADVVALRRIEEATERVIEIELRDGALHRMAQRFLRDDAGRDTIADHAGLEALIVAISERLALGASPAPQVSEGLSFWNRRPGIAILCLMFALSVAISAAAVVALAGGTNLHGAALKGTAVVLLLPPGAGYLLVKAVRRRAWVLRGAPAGDGSASRTR